MRYQRICAYTGCKITGSPVSTKFLQNEICNRLAPLLIIPHLNACSTLSTSHPGALVEVSLAGGALHSSLPRGATFYACSPAPLLLHPLLHPPLYLLLILLLPCVQLPTCILRLLPSPLPGIHRLSYRFDIVCSL